MKKYAIILAAACPSFVFGAFSGKAFRSLVVQASAEDIAFPQAAASQGLEAGSEEHTRVKVALRNLTMRLCPARMHIPVASLAGLS